MNAIFAVGQTCRFLISDGDRSIGYVDNAAVEWSGYDSLLVGQEYWTKPEGAEWGINAPNDYRVENGRWIDQTLQGNATIAEQITERFTDGASYTTNDGVSFTELIESIDIVYTSTDPERELTRYEFRDGSAIVDSGQGWDVEGSTPFSWQGVEG